MRRISLLTLGLVGCEVITSKETGDTGTTYGSDTDSPTITSVDDTGATPPDWSTVAGPCSGYRTETLVFLVDGSAWAGCGADTGLFYAQTPGAWQSVPTYANYHTYDLFFGDDGFLYTTGDEANNDNLVYRLDIDDPANVVGETLHTSAMDVDAIKLGGTIVRTDDGVIFTESQNGNQYAVSTDDGDSFTMYYYSGHQFLDTSTDGAQIWASGSTIAEPPMIFVPGATADQLTSVVLTEAFSGEVWGLHVLDADHLVAVGVDEQTDHGVLYRCLDGGCDQASNWQIDDLNYSNVVGGMSDSGRLWAVHFDRSGTHGCVVGEHFPQSNGGFVLHTKDGGESWELEEGFDILTDCWAFADGSFAVAGGDGFMSISRPL